MSPRGNCQTAFPRYTRPAIMTTAPPELIIEAGHTERNYWRDLFRYRELFYFLAWRDVLVRYKQTVIGVLWAVLRPLLTMIVFTFVFSRIAKLPSGGIPYPVLVFAAMLPWQLFATSLSEGSGSLINNANLISKVYFPRLIVPASAVIVSFVDFKIAPRLGRIADFVAVIPDEEENEKRNEFAVLLVVLREKTEPGPFPNWLSLICVKAEETKEINDRAGDGAERKA